MSIQDEMGARIKAALPDAELSFTDLTGGGDHWEAVIVSDLFQGMSPIARQRKVYAALGELMAGPVHAFTMKTLTREQAGRAGN